MADNERLKTALQTADDFVKNAVNPMSIKDGKLGWTESDGSFTFLHDIANAICRRFCKENGFSADGDDPCGLVECAVSHIYTAAWYYYEKYHMLKKAIEKEIAEAADDDKH